MVTYVSAGVAVYLVLMLVHWLTVHQPMRRRVQAGEGGDVYIPSPTPPPKPEPLPPGALAEAIKGASGYKMDMRMITESMAMDAAVSYGSDLVARTSYSPKLAVEARKQQSDIMQRAHQRRAFAEEMRLLPEGSRIELDPARRWALVVHLPGGGEPLVFDHREKADTIRKSVLTEHRKRKRRRPPGAELERP